jgi:hypothetical protein
MLVGYGPTAIADGTTPVGTGRGEWHEGGTA